MRIGIYGGSFNPVHVGHLRLAVEAAEALELDRLDILPAHDPPHKTGRGLLPFAFRLSLLRAACAPFPLLQVRDLESRRQGPSYTFDTLALYAEEDPDAERYFLLGATDLLTLPSWYRGEELPCLAHLVAVSRMDVELASVANFVAQFWPEARTVEGEIPDVTAWRTPRGGDVLFLPIPRLDISSSQVRRLWLAGKQILGLVPESVQAALEEKREMVTEIWKEE